MKERANIKIHLQKRDYTRIASVQPGSVITCDAGVLWVTQSGDRQDYILQAGEEMEVTGKGAVVVEAFSEADLHIS